VAGLGQIGEDRRVTLNNELPVQIQMGRGGPSAPLSTGTTWPASHQSWWGRYSCKSPEHLEICSGRI